MLTIITGADRTTLSNQALQHIKCAAERGEAGWILVVPEQFSYEAERRLCRIGGDMIGRFAEVLSFSRLSDRVAAKEGGAAGAYLDKGGQLLSMALAAEQVASRIKLYAAVLRKPEFLADMIRMIGELRSYCIEPGELFRASKNAEGQFAQKLEEMGILYEAYLAICANSKADPADKLLRLLDLLEDCRWIRSMRFYFDGFSDFTGAELKIIELLVRYAAQVCINLPTGMQGSVMHRAAEKSARELHRLAKTYGVECVSKSVEARSHRNEEVQLLLEHMFSYCDLQARDTSVVKLAAFSSAEEETRAAVRAVKELLLQGARCRDISVATTDMRRYEVPLRNAFQAAGICAYFAGERSLLSEPVVTAVMNSLFAAAGAMEYEDVALYLKSGLPLLELDRCDRLDNYAYLWNLRGSRWSSEWKLHPRGFGEAMTDEDAACLEKLNADRVIAMRPLLRLRKGLLEAKNTGDMVLALHQFTEDVNLRERLENKANEYAAQGLGQSAQELMQIYEILIQSMEQTWLTLGQTVRTADDFCRLYQMVLTQYQVATVPAGLDQVHVSDLPDLRNRQTKHLLVLGAGDGSFPSYKTAEGLLTEEERILLMEQGVAVAPGRADQMDQELSKIFFALSAAEESLYLSYSSDQPAWLFRRAAALYPGAVDKTADTCVLNEEELAAWRLRYQDNSVCDVDNLEMSQAVIDKLRNYKFAPLKEQTVQGLYGAPIALSPSKIDKYAACRFAFFMNYGLKAKPRKQAKLDQPAFGTFVHAVLEHTVLRVKELGGFQTVTREQLLDIATEEIARYADAYFPEQAKREEYLFNRSKKEIWDIVLDLWEELRRSKFQPAFCELKFTGGQELPAVQINGEKADCRIVGMVDRVDLFKDGDKTYVRVVDYKTGVKDFDYTDILNGAGLQMLIYLFALQTAGKAVTDTECLEAAGVLYLPAKKEYPLTEPMPDDELVAREHRDRRKRKGLIRDDEHLLAAMEEDPFAPQFMPYKNGRKGLTGDLASAEQMELLEHHVTRTIAAMADQIAEGGVVPDPVVRGQYSSCNYCDYKMVCHKDLGTQEKRILAETNAVKFWEKLEQEEREHG